MKQHIVLGMSAALIADTITVLLHFYGAHDVQGFFLAIAGFPGVVASTHSVEPNDVLLHLSIGFSISHFLKALLR